jgi:hypothetical protein
VKGRVQGFKGPGVKGIEKYGFKDSRGRGSKAVKAAIFNSNLF